MEWLHNDIKRIILDLSLKIMQEPFTGNAAFYQLTQTDWKDDIGLNSIEFMALAAAVNSFFHIFEVENAPYLLSSTKVDEWVEMVLSARHRLNENISFNTSGTSGETKIVTHKLTYLIREAAFLAAIFDDAGCVIPYVPSYTIYGFLLGIALPRQLDIPVIFPSGVKWQQLHPNSLIVATPFNWQMLIASTPHLVLNCFGVTAAAPMYPALRQELAVKGIRLTELYGATETSGIAYREADQQKFKLFPYWQLEAGGKVRDRDDSLLYYLMDDIEQFSTDTFILIGRKDKQVKVAGKLVNLDAVTAKIGKLANVRQCDLSAKAINGDTRIQASIVLEADNEPNRAAIKTALRQLLAPHEIPGNIYFS